MPHDLPLVSIPGDTWGGCRWTVEEEAVSIAVVLVFVNTHGSKPIPPLLPSDQPEL